jgi:dynein heavy chain
MGEVKVPTPETTSINYWLDILVGKALPCMLVGSAGCGKTQLINGMLSKLNPEKTLTSTINFNFYTGSEALRANLEAPLEKKTGQNFGPPGSADLIFFLDDLNLPQLDKYDTQSAIELARQFINYGHWYDPYNPAKGFKSVTKCQFLACLNPTAGSFNINPRLQRQFITFAISFPGPASLLAIYETFLNGHLKNFKATIQDLSANIIASALKLHVDVAKTFRKSAVNFHYEFNIRHMSNVFQGLLVAKPEKFDEPEKFVALWLHESERVYSDRLVNYENIKQYASFGIGLHQGQVWFLQNGQVLQWW